jgi:hypothetical protein
MAKAPKDHKAKEHKMDEPKKKELTVVPHPAEEEDISAEMADLFDEEAVKHQHGHAEPEGD